MRIAVVSPLPPDHGGIAHTSERLVVALRALGHHVDAVAWRRHYPQLLYPGSVPSLTVDAGAGDAFFLTWYNPLTWWRASRLARKSDLVVFAWVTAWDAAAYWTISALGGTRCVAIVHNDEPHERMPLSGTLTRIFLHRMDKVVVLSRAVARGVLDRWPALDVVVGSHPPSFDVTPSPAPPMPPLCLVHPGYIRDYKGPDVAIEACALARSRGLDVELQIVGEAWTNVEELRELAASLDLETHVRIDDGYLSDDDLISAVLDSHAVILPYRSASQSGLVPLALAAHRPLIVTDVGGLVEQVQRDRNAVVAMQPTPASVAEAIESLATNYTELAAGTSEPTVGWDRFAAIVLE